MRKWLIFFFIIVLAAGGVLYSVHANSRNDRLEFPFEASDVEGMTLYRVGEFAYGDVRYHYDTNVFEPRHTAEKDTINYYYKKFSTMELKELREKDLQKLDIKYDGPYSEVAFQFDLKDGDSYVLIFRAFGIKAGVFQTPDGTAYFSIGDYNGVWGNLYESME